MTPAPQPLTNMTVEERIDYQRRLERLAKAARRADSRDRANRYGDIRKPAKRSQRIFDATRKPYRPTVKLGKEVTIVGACMLVLMLLSAR